MELGLQSNINSAPIEGQYNIAKVDGNVNFTKKTR